MDRTTVLIALSAVLLGALYMLAATWVESRFAGVVPSGSAVSVSPAGLSVWHDYLARLGEDPRLLTDFSSLPATGTLVVAGPLESDFTATDLHRLGTWVRAGGRLVLAGEGASQVAIGTQMVPDGLPGSTIEASSVTPTFPSDLSVGVNEIATGPNGGSEFVGTEWVGLFAHGNEAVVATRRLGAGTVIWLTDSTPVSNAGIGLYDDARFAVRLARTGGGGPVYFDEYHHGLNSQESVWTRLGGGGRAGIILLLAAVLVWLLSRGRRTGPAIARIERPAARGSAYIAQLAELYRTAGARAEALQSLEEGLVRAVARRYGGRVEGLARCASARQALETSAALRQRGRIEKTEFVAAAALLRAARNEVEGGNG
jgi:hypothetical protein